MWFFWAVAAIIIGGLHAFILKVAVERKYDSVLISSVAPLISACIGTGALFVLGSTYEPTYAFIGYAVLSAVLFIVISVLRMEGLGHIDTTIYFPVNKTASTLVAVGIGVLLLHDSLTPYQYLGALLGVIVPLLLMNRAEHARQKNIIRGVQFAVMTAVLSSVAQMVNSLGVSKASFEGSILFLTLIHIFTAVLGLVYFRVKRGAHSASVIFRKEFSTPQQWGFVMLVAIIHFGAFLSLLMAFSGGYFSVVYVITSLGIMVPIALSVVVYGEHWNTRKLGALALTVASVILLRE